MIKLQLQIQWSCTMFILLAPFATGCGESVTDDRPARAKVTGTIVLDGSPVSGANVVLHSESNQGKDAVGKSGADGTFTLTTFTPGDGALPGEYRVTVSKVESTSTVTEEQAQQLLAQGRRVPPSKRTEVLPKKYTEPSTSPLTFTVEADTDNVLTIELQE